MKNIINSKNNLFLLVGFLFIYQLNAQYSNSKNELPFGYKYQSFIDEAEFKKIPQKNLDSILHREEKLKETSNTLKPHRIGFQNDVNTNFNDQKKWTNVGQSDSIFRLSFFVENAKAVSFLFDKFWLAEGDTIYIYNKQKTHFLGSFTNRHNNGSREYIRGFTSGLLAGNEVILEYHPSNNKEAIISLESVVNIYNPPIFLTGKIIETFKNGPPYEFGYQSGGYCQVNVNCSPEGDDWQDEKKSVILIILNGTEICTGHLLNNTLSDDKPYLLTADHCINNHDAITDPDMDYFDFVFMYETDSCSNPYSEPSYSQLNSSATVLANEGVGGDYALLELNKNPKEILSNDSIYYAGWDRTNNQDTGGMGIHHPMGDVKKISTVDGTTSPWEGFIGDTYYYGVNWRETDNGWGIIRPGSSGSPLFNLDSKVIGQLSSSNRKDCNEPNDQSATYGALYTHWDGSQKERRLKDWLDPLGISPTALNGRYAGSSSVNPCAYAPDSVKMENLTISFDYDYPVECSNYYFENVTIEDSAAVTVNFNDEVVILSDFEIKQGSTFEILPD